MRAAVVLTVWWDQVSKALHEQVSVTAISFLGFVVHF